MVHCWFLPDIFDEHVQPTSLLRRQHSGRSDHPGRQEHQAFPQNLELLVRTLFVRGTYGPIQALLDWLASCSEVQDTAVVTDRMPTQPTSLSSHEQPNDTDRSDIRGGMLMQEAVERMMRLGTDPNGVMHASQKWQ